MSTENVKQSENNENMDKREIKEILSLCCEERIDAWDRWCIKA